MIVSQLFLCSYGTIASDGSLVNIVHLNYCIFFLVIFLLNLLNWTTIHINYVSDPIHFRSFQFLL